MKCTEQTIVYENSTPLLVSRQAVFPGIVELSGGELVAVFSIGQAFDSADQRAYCCRSSDHGRSWSEPRLLHTQDYGQEMHSESLKPLLLANGDLLATGYAFVRPDALTPIVDENTFAVLPMQNKISISRDGGRNWTVPERIDVEGQPLEMSGPCIQLQCGRILGAAAPFHLGESGHSGWIVFSDDLGKNWGKLSEFFRSDNGAIAAWECRLCETSPGQIAVLFWAYDNKLKRNLNNHIVFSTDGGKSFAQALDTGVPGQASNLLASSDHQILTIHAHREAPIGLVMRRVDISGHGFKVLETLDLFANEDLGSDSTDIRKQFGSLKFGQPSLLHLETGEVLATCWLVENNQHVIKSFIVDIQNR